MLLFARVFDHADQVLVDGELSLAQLGGHQAVLAQAIQLVEAVDDAALASDTQTERVRVRVREEEEEKEHNGVSSPTRRQQGEQHKRQGGNSKAQTNPASCAVNGS